MTQLESSMIWFAQCFGCFDSNRTILTDATFKYIVRLYDELQYGSGKIFKILIWKIIKIHRYVLEVFVFQFIYIYEYFETEIFTLGILFLYYGARRTAHFYI